VLRLTRFEAKSSDRESDRRRLRGGVGVAGEDCYEGVGALGFVAGEGVGAVGGGGGGGRAPVA